MELKITYLPIESLKKYEKNPRKNQKAIPIVKKSIQEYGFKNPIIIDKNNVIIAGHTRLEASKELGYTEVPTIQVTDLNEDQIKAFRIMDNKSQEYAGWDFELLRSELKDINLNLDLTGIKEAELNRIIEAQPEREGRGKEPKYSLSEGLYKLGRHYLWLGDCTKLPYEQILGNHRVSLVYTDPPYGVSYKGNKSEPTQEKMGMRVGKDWDVIEGDDLRGEDLYKLLEDSFNRVNEVLANGVGAYVFHSSSNQMIFQTALNNTGWEVKQQLIWKKPSVLSNSHYHWAHEPIFYCSRKCKPINFYGDRKNKTIIDFDPEEITPEQALEILKIIKSQSTIVEFKRDNVAKYIHPTQKPVNMAEHFIINNTLPNEWVVDMFGGSGSTLLACESKNRRCITAEMDVKYASHIIERWENKTKKKHEKIDLMKETFL